MSRRQGKLLHELILDPAVNTDGLQSRARDFSATMRNAELHDAADAVHQKYTTTQRILHRLCTANLNEQNKLLVLVSFVALPGQQQ